MQKQVNIIRLGYTHKSFRLMLTVVAIVTVSQTSLNFIFTVIQCADRKLYPSPLSVLAFPGNGSFVTIVVQQAVVYIGLVSMYFKS